MSTHWQLLPFNFRRMKDGRILLVNQAGGFSFISTSDFEKVLSGKIEPDSRLYYRLQDAHILADDDLDLQVEMLANQLRSRKSFLNDFTSLHMVVVTCRCNFHCEYCHASSSDLSLRKGDMSSEVASQTVKQIFSSPSQEVKIEFQGGEPLLNWPIIKQIVEQAEKINQVAKRRLEFVICTNLTLMTEDIAVYCKQHNIYISTSMDGPEEIQNANRHPRDNCNGYEQFKRGLVVARNIIGRDACSPLLTVTKSNLHKLNIVVNHYLDMGFHGVFIRALNPYGYAVTNMDKLGYGVEEFVDAYKHCLNYIIAQNLKGNYFIEYYAALLLQRILTPFSTGFVDLQSPCGDVIGGALYDYDGNVYASDEGRMLARTGDRKFLLGNVMRDDWQDIFAGSKAREIVRASCVETLPECALCAYKSYCGASPVRYYTECGDYYGRRASSDFCRKNKMIIDYVFELLSKQDDDINDVFASWLTERPLEEIRRHD